MGQKPKSFIITGVKTVKDVTIITTEETGKEGIAHVGTEVPAVPLTVEPKATYKPTTQQNNKTQIAGPIVFAFEVEKLGVNQTEAEEYVKGAILDHRYDVDYTIERAGNKLNDDKMKEFRLEACLGVDETDTECPIIVPCIA